VAQVVQNIVINATEVMPRGGAIRIRAQNVELGVANPQLLPPGPYLRIGILDEGPGIPPGIRDRIFEPFFSTKSRGSGLGLSVCHSIVAKHDGRIEVAASAGSGAAFEIYLPAVPGADPVERLPDGADATIRGRVLIMDDEESIRHATLKILAAVGCDAIASSNGQEAVARYQEARKAGNPFDVVILDLTVSGGMGGTETLEELKKLDLTVCAIVSSGYSNDPVVASHASFGFAAVLEKPFEPSQVRDVVGRVIASHKATLGGAGPATARARPS
jgi:CheY-like chemotaxis protein